MYVDIFKQLVLLVMIVAWCGLAFAEDAEERDLSLVSTTGAASLVVTRGDAIAVEVRVKDATNVAGASFTITYDTANLVLESIDTDFFGTFAEQISEDTGCVTVDEKYCSPIVENTVATGTMIAAARATQGSGTSVTMFTLNFALQADGVAGDYEIGLIPSTILNAAAGYKTETDLPVLVGIDDAGGYPVYDVPDVTPFSLTINDFIDTDKDGIDDNWEISYLPAGYTGKPLELFSTYGDYDSDGYSDLREYLNSGEVDLDGNPYSPVVANAPDGTGYRPPAKSLEPMYLLLFEE